MVDMKNNYLLSALLSVFIVSSCTTYYYVQTEVGNDLSVDRNVHASGKDKANVEFPFYLSDGWTVSKVSESIEIDFYDVREKMEYVAHKNASSIGEVNVAGMETVEKRFRWFYTFYNYRAVFDGLRDRLPLSFEGYFTEEQLELFFRGSAPPGDWNGIEMYCLLDSITRNFAEWYSDATYFVMCDVFGSFCTHGQVEVLKASKNRFMEGLEHEAMFAMRPDEFEDRLAAIAPEAGFGKVYEDNSREIAAAYERETEIIDCFEHSFMFSVDMPGRYVAGNAESFIDDVPAWKVDAYRLMYGDLILEATSRKANLWAFILTFAVIALLLQIFGKLFSK